MKKVIFICHGSICRSPAAENIAAYLSKDFEFASRAISYEEIGNDIYPPMKSALNRAGIPFKRHYAEYLSQQDIEEASCIFYMDDSNARRLAYAYPKYKDKFMPIYRFTPSITEIEDPWYTDRYDLVVRQITACVKDILKNIV